MTSPICVADQCDVCCSVRIVLDTNNRCRNSVFAVSLEVDDSVFSSASTAVMSNSDLSLIVTTSVLLREVVRAFSGVVFVISEKSEPSYFFWKVYMDCTS